MKRKASALMLAALISGGCALSHGPETGGGPPAHYGQQYGPPTVPGLEGAYGAKVPMAAPYNSAPPMNPNMARQMMSNSVPLDFVQMNRAGMTGQGGPGGMLPPTPVPPGGVLSPVGMPYAPGANPMAQAGFAPGDGASGVINANIAPGQMPPSAVVQAQMVMAPPTGATASAMGSIRFPVARSQVRFVRPSGMKISWIAQAQDGSPIYSDAPIETPGRYNFLQAAIYRLKLSNIEGRPGLELYPTMEVVPSNAKTEAFLSHSAVPVEFTAEDFRNIADGNYVVKVIYLPDPQYQDVSGSGTDEILSTRLEPGADPIQEALRRGSILLVIRMGNVDQEAPNTPSLNAPQQGRAPIPMPGPSMPAAPNVQLPYMGVAPGSSGVMSMPGPFLGNVPPSVAPQAPLAPLAPLAPPAPLAAPAPAAPLAPLAPQAPAAPPAPTAPNAPLAPTAPLAPPSPVAPLAPQSSEAPLGPPSVTAPVAPFAPSLEARGEANGLPSPIGPGSPFDVDPVAPATPLPPAQEVSPLPSQAPSFPNVNVRPDFPSLPPLPVDDQPNSALSDLGLPLIPPLPH